MKKNYKIALLVTSITLLVGAGVLYYYNRSFIYDVDRTPHKNSTEDQEAVNYGPPTEEELEETEDFKEDQANEDGNQQENIENDNVTVTLTRVSVSEDLVTVAGYANNDVAGECRLALSGGDQTKNYTNPTEHDPTSPDIVNCSTFRVPRNELSDASKWTAVITYVADRYSGTSQEWEFDL